MAAAGCHNGQERTRDTPQQGMPMTASLPSTSMSCTCCSLPRPRAPVVKPYSRLLACLDD